MSFIAGPYTVTYDSNALGIMEDAPRMELTNEGDAIVGDNMGGSVQDGIYRGGNMFMDIMLQEYDAAGAAGAFWPFHTAFNGALGVIGVTWASLAKAMVFTAVAGTNATPSPITFNKAILAPRFPVQMLFGSRHRNVGIRFQLLPFNGGSPAADRWFL